ncbi:MAG: hypothetical protein L3J57_14255 [Desulfuromusa sp.]|nr:hypothetical protein [Desulfuromusa sp.]
MSVAPLFGTLNATVSGTIARNTPKGTRRIVEPFGDGGTLALELKKKRPKEHIVNIVDEDLFKAFDFIKNATSGEIRTLKKYDWISSQETFDAVLGINADAGPEMFYRWYYLKKLGMVMEPDTAPEYDLLSTGHNLGMKLLGIPLMKVGLKKTDLINEDPLSVITSYGSSGTFMILLPSGAEQIEATRQKLTGLSADFFFAGKVKEATEIFDDAESFGQFNVSALSAASIMMAKLSVISNYDSGLPVIDLKELAQ